MGSDKYITEIRNEKGFVEYVSFEDPTENCIEIEIPEEEYEYLWDVYILDHINDVCDLYIDDCESEIIFSEMFDDCIRILEPYKERIPIFYDSFIRMKKEGYAIALDF